MIPVTTHFPSSMSNSIHIVQHRVDMDTIGLIKDEVLGRIKHKEWEVWNAITDELDSLK
jgi:hypothetical protein